MNEKKWNTQELEKEFEVISFLAPFVIVMRKKDNKRGTMRFNDYPREYFDFKVSKWVFTLYFTIALGVFAA